jgi:hypothetical protein
MTKNYEITKGGFTVKDTKTNHILKVTYKNGVYQGVVTMPEQSIQLPLSDWKKGENPFRNDTCFEGRQTGYSPKGYWWFRINTSLPFSQILAEVEALSNTGGFLKKLFMPKTKNKVKLLDVVKKQNQTGYIFVDIINDLGESTEGIMASSKLIQMTYGYARRAAAIALYLQGLIDKDGYDHNLSFFKAIQLKTEQSVDFQEQAFTHAIEYMQTYNPIITRMLVKQMAMIAQDFEVPDEKLNDEELISIIMETYTN